MSKHTPGPWVVTSVDGWDGVKPESGGSAICKLVENNFKNARLIAAAPDMLAMLERTRDELEASGGFEGDENLFWAIVALIARATGEQS